MARLIDAHSKETVEDIAELAMKLAANSKTRKAFLSAVKEVDPTKRFPSHEVDTLREEMETKYEADKAERQLEAERKETERRLNAQRAALAGRLNDDQIKEVEAVMTKYGLTDYEAGADLYEARRPPTPPNDPTATWDFPTLDGLLADPTKAARNEAFKVITELKRGRAA